MASDGADRRRWQAVIGAGTLLLGVAVALGSRSISSEAGYGGVGPNFLPLVVGIALVLCGIGLLWEALRGGWHAVEPPSGASHGDWGGFVAVSAGLLLVAATITTIGFILACTLCFVLASQGFRAAEGQGWGGPRRWLRDALGGLAIAAPVYWLFTQALGLTLPGLTGTGWL